MSLSVFERLPDWALDYQQRVSLFIQSFGQRHGLPAGPGLGEGQAFEFDGVAMSFRYDPTRMPLHLVVAVDFGPLPDDALPACRELLEANHLEFSRGSVYTVAPETGHVVCFASLSIEGLDDGRLDASLGALSAAARALR
ncbi:MAG: hypothetical protein RJA99_3935 [Pseudomonadota bacterium]|jgi:hypothetical protein